MSEPTAAKSEKSSPKGGSDAAAGNGAASGLPLERAEEIVDRMGERVGHFAVNFSHQVTRWMARVREEAEDILAEAQSIRRGEPPQ